MTASSLDLRINDKRFGARFEALARIGAALDRGIDRPAFGEAHFEARRWFLETAERAGLETAVDGAGNHSALFRCGPTGAPTLLLGSHLDSGPNGGRYDGALGVLASVKAPPAEMADASDEDRYLRAAPLALEEDMADLVVLGCAGMPGLDKRLSAELGAPVLDGVVCALIIATGLVRYGVSTSKVRRFNSDY